LEIKENGSFKPQELKKDKIINTNIDELIDEFKKENIINDIEKNEN
jgi:hypothetical protein